jgi:hypothetical protein
VLYVVCEVRGSRPVDVLFVLDMARPRLRCTRAATPLPRAAPPPPIFPPTSSSSACGSSFFFSFPLTLPLPTPPAAGQPPVAKEDGLPPHLLYIADDEPPTPHQLLTSTLCVTVGANPPLHACDDATTPTTLGLCHYLSPLHHHLSQSEAGSAWLFSNPMKKGVTQSVVGVTHRAVEFLFWIGH